jgi:hypothetical protein
MVFFGINGIAKIPLTVNKVAIKMDSRDDSKITNPQKTNARIESNIFLKLRTFMANFK